MSTEPKSVKLTEAEQTTLITALLDPDFDCAHNFGPLFREVTRMVAAARREALLEAADAYSDWEVFVAADGINSLRTHGLAPDAWLRRYSEGLAEPERDEETQP